MNFLGDDETGIEFLIFGSGVGHVIDPAAQYYTIALLQMVLNE